MIFALLNICFRFGLSDLLKLNRICILEFHLRDLSLAANNALDLVAAAPKAETPRRIACTIARSAFRPKNDITPPLAGGWLQKEEDPEDGEGGCNLGTRRINSPSSAAAANWQKSKRPRRRAHMLPFLAAAAVGE
jgi:hypothetical protein